MTIEAVLLAAGAATRMRGTDKLTESVRGTPLLRDRVEMLLNTQVSRLVVVLPMDRPARLETLAGLDVEHVINRQAQTGMASSIQAGLSELRPHAEAALIMPADMPDLTVDDVNHLIAEYETAPHLIHRASTKDGIPGSPVIFPASFFASLQKLEGDESGRSVIKANESKVRLHALAENRAVTDLDTPEAWAAWRVRSTGE